MNILILGGSGFVGRAICNKLVSLGHAVTVPTRKRDNARSLFMLPTVTVIEADIQDDAALAKLTQGKQAVINLVGILNEKKRGDFHRAHVELTQRVLAACKAQGVKRYLHMSALGAAADAPSVYLTTKFAAEQAVAASGLAATVFAPSVIFGRDDSFLNRFSKLIDLTPPLAPFVLPGASAKFQPIFVDDVAHVFVTALTDATTVGQRYELVGPQVYSLRELVRYLMTIKSDSHLIIGLPGFATHALAAVMQFIPAKPLTPDNVRSMSVDNVSNQSLPKFAGIRATSLELIAPTYIGRAAVTDTFATARKRAGDRQ